MSFLSPSPAIAEMVTQFLNALGLLSKRLEMLEEIAIRIGELTRFISEINEELTMIRQSLEDQKEQQQGEPDEELLQMGKR